MNTEYLTDIVETTTVNNQPATTTVGVAIQVATATAAVDGLAVGDVTVVLSQALNDNIEAAVKVAAQACAAAVKREDCTSHRFLKHAPAALTDLVHSYDLYDQRGIHRC